MPRTTKREGIAGFMAADQPFTMPVMASREPERVRGYKSFMQRISEASPFAKGFYVEPKGALIGATETITNPDLGEPAEAGQARELPKRDKHGHFISSKRKLKRANPKAIEKVKPKWGVQKRGSSKKDETEGSSPIARKQVKPMTTLRKRGRPKKVNTDSTTQITHRPRGRPRASPAGAQGEAEPSGSAIPLGAGE